MGLGRATAELPRPGVAINFGHSAVRERRHIRPALDHSQRLATAAGDVHRQTQAAQQCARSKQADLIVVDNEYPRFPLGRWLVNRDLVLKRSGTRDHQDVFGLADDRLGGMRVCLGGTRVC